MDLFEVVNEDGKSRARCKMCNNLSLGYSGGSGNRYIIYKQKHPTMLDRNKRKKQTALFHLNLVLY